jgi:hypothetical protein
MRKQQKIFIRDYYDKTGTNRFFQFHKANFINYIQTLCIPFDSTKMSISPRICKKSVLTKDMSERRWEAECSYPARRTVSLAQSVEIHYIPARSDISEEEISDVWYSKFENRRIRRDYNQIVNKIIAGTYEYDIDCLESESRGLEMNTPERMARDVALCAVLDEQDRQEAWYGRIVDHKRIAKACRKISAQCQEKAIRIAANDAKLVHGHNKIPICDSKLQNKPAVAITRFSSSKTYFKI